LINKLTKQAMDLITDNAPGILTGVGVVGTIGTSVLTGRASFKAADVIRQADIEYRNEKDGHGRLETTDKVKLVWPLFVPPVLSGAGTIAAIVFSNRIHAGQVAAMATLYGLSQDRFQDYREKVAEQFGQSKEKKVLDAASQEQVSRTEGSQVIILGEGEVLCFDKFSGRYFRSTMDKIKKAENAVNRDIYNYDYASLSLFYEEAGLKPTSQSDNVGWNSGNRLEVEYSATFTDDEKPCIAIDFKYAPTVDYINGRQ
jgi:hypothetical protein